MSEKSYVVSAYILLAAVFTAGLFIPLMNNDAGEYALIALNMAQENDFVNITRKGQDYLDKPHMLFWLSALSFKIFGAHGFAYKLPSLLFSIIAIYSTTRLGTILFNKKTGVVAGLMLGFSQAFIISNYDVRTDAILTGATIFAIWQFISFSGDKKYYHIILGALGLAVAVGTKGILAIIVTGLVIIIHMLYHKRIKEIFHWKWLSSIFWLFIFLSPVLYCYYLQFDSQPHKIANGVKGMSGIKFLLWTQSFERLAGQRNMVNNSDVLFFFHTFLWAFLPWSIIAYYETFRDWIITIKNKFLTTRHVQFALSGAAFLIMLLMSTSQFKLPHYLNIIFPLFALIAAKSVFRFIEEKGKISGWMRAILYGISGLYFLLGIILNVWAFPLSGIFQMIITMFACLFLLAVIFRKFSFPLKPVFVTMLIAGTINLVLNLNFFPQVMTYQGSKAMADYVNRNNIPKDFIIGFTHRSYFAFDFALKRDIPEPPLAEIQKRSAAKEPFYILTDKQKLPELITAGVPLQQITTVPHFHVSRLNLKFINPATRAATLDSLMLMKVN